MRYAYVQDGEWFALPRWLVCCDCGLVHRIEVRRQRGRLRMRAFRERRRTGQVRRWRHYPGGRRSLGTRRHD